MKKSEKIFVAHTHSNGFLQAVAAWERAEQLGPEDKADFWATIKTLSTSGGAERIHIGFDSHTSPKAPQQSALATLSDEIYALLRDARLATFSLNELLDGFFDTDELDGSQACAERLVVGYGRAQAQAVIAMSTREASEIWGLSIPSVLRLCNLGRIPGAGKVGHGWVIPRCAGRPLDARITTGRWVGYKPKYRRRRRM